MSWIVPRMWEEGDVWIIGGGSSIPIQFNIPKSVVQQVISGASSPSAYSPYMFYLHDKHVIGINVAYQIGDWIDMVFFGDGAFFLKHKEQLAAFPGLKVSCDPKVTKYAWVKYLPRDSSHTRGISSNPRMVSWNFNSGAAAISVAANAGASRIILLGFDMKMGRDNIQHWHDLYGKGSDASPKRMKALPFDRHLRGFPEIAKDAKRMNIEILNASPDSAIDCFPKYSVKELIYNNS